MFGLKPKSVQSSLTKTREGFFGKISRLLGQRQITEELWEELEELLIQADIGVETTVELIEQLREGAERKNLKWAHEVNLLLREHLEGMLANAAPHTHLWPSIETATWVTPHVVLMVGVNGVGKTTSIAKLTKYYQKRNRKVLLAAADTFRAAAIEQLKIWGDRVNAEVIAHQQDADPGAVVFDAIKAAQKRDVDALIIDTAGRLHTKFNLMQELSKLRKIIDRQLPDDHRETMLVLDATTGQNALSQAKYFNEAADLTGIILAKLDGTAKGGIIFPIAQELQVPIRFIGTGEHIEDWVEFKASDFVEGLFE